MTELYKYPGPLPPYICSITLIELVLFVLCFSLNNRVFFLKKKDKCKYCSSERNIKIRNQFFLSFFVLTKSYTKYRFRIMCCILINVIPSTKIFPAHMIWTLANRAWVIFGPTYGHGPGLRSS